MSPLTRLLHWAVSPEKLEYLEGDLMELGSERTGQGPLGIVLETRDTLSICFRHSRFAAPRWRIRLATAVLAGMAVAALLRAGEHPPRMNSTLTATDPAGSFTLQFREGKVIAGTMNGDPIDPARLRQRGNELIIAGGDWGQDFRIEVTAQGIRWQARRPSPD